MKKKASVSSRSIQQQPKEERQISSDQSFICGAVQIAARTVLVIIMLGSSTIAGGLIGLAIGLRNLPDVRMLRYYAPTETNYIYDIRGKLLTSLHGEANRRIVKLDQISSDFKKAVLATKF